MANHVGIRLSRLIRERAYLAGSLPGLEQQALDLKSQLKKTRNSIQHANARLKELDSAIAQLSSINTDDIRAIRPTPKTLGAVHGAFSRELIAVLQTSPIPISTEEIILHMAAVFDLPRETPAERDDTRRRVTKRLRVFVAKKAVERLHDPSGNDGGMWRWIGGYTGAADGA